jgi:hypothetical protein
MPEVDLTLTNLFAVRDSAFMTSAQTVLQSSMAIASLKDALADRARLLQWPWVVQQIRKKLPGLFDITVIDLLVLAWKKYLLLSKYADKNKYPPDDVILVPLAEHSLKCQQHPYLQVMVGERPAGKIVFDVMLSLKLKGFVVKIHNAHIEAIQAGTCEGKGSIGLGDAVLAEKALSIKLPGAIDLGEGIALQA